MCKFKKDSDAPLYYLSQNQRRNQENMKYRKVTRIIYPLKLHGVHAVSGGMRWDTEVWRLAASMHRGTYSQAKRLD